MVEAKGYWLSIQTNNTQYRSEHKIDNSQIKYIVKIHNGDSPVTAAAHNYNDAIQALKDKLRALKASAPQSLPAFEDFEAPIENEVDNIAMVFLSESDLENAN
tara:strand:+ start:463 stop:771 length:309 start_codon:yes stop_codon:yes gene_type:complete